MKNTPTFLSIVIVVVLVVVGFFIGERIGSLNRVQPDASATSLPISTPVDFFSQEFASSTDIVPVNGLAVGGLGDALLKSSVWNSLLDYERKQNCTDLKSTAISVAQINEAGSFWIENWTVNACGRPEVFKVNFTPDQVGGTIYSFVP